MNIRQVRQKIKSVGNVKKITKAMEMVSAVKMKKTQQTAIEGRPYQSSLEEVIRKIVKNIDPGFSLLLTPKKDNDNRELGVLISTNKGLCGSFNFNLFRYLLNEIDSKKTDFVVLGKKGSLFAYKMGGNIIADFSTSMPINSVSAIFNLILKNYIDGKYFQITLYYNKFISTLNYEPVREILLPVQLLIKKEENVKEVLSEYLVEPSPQTIIDALLKSFVEEKIRNAIIQTEAGEHSARMIAMKNATDNAEDVIYNLTMLRNKLRQEKITGELLDMITATQSAEV